MSKLSVIIPSRNELFLSETIKDLMTKSVEEIEIIAVLDGYWPTEKTCHDFELWKSLLAENDPRLKFIHFTDPRGMRGAINAGAAVARGDYLMKCDAHCMFDYGFDHMLESNCDDDWLVVPRRKRLDAENWCIQDVGKPDIDYEFLSYPWWKPEQIGLHGTIWKERTLERMSIPLDEDMSFQGSCWFMPKPFFDRLGPMQEEGYGTFIGEPQELGLKVWLSGGKQMRNKMTWYAHLHKGNKFGRGYSINSMELRQGNLYSCDYWYNNRWPDRVRDIEWLVDHFWPVPSWPGRERSEWKPLSLS